MLRTQQVAPRELVEIRPAAPADAVRLAGFVHGLSPDTRVARFFAGGVRPGESMLRLLLASDDRRDALLAVLTGTQEVVGHAMSYRRPGTTVVEIALVVADGRQGQGYGSRLADALLDRAAARGATAVGMDVMGDNRRALAIIRRRWPRAVTKVDSGTVEVLAPL